MDLAEPERRKENEVSFDSVGPPWITSHIGLKVYTRDIK
jgi:hypothetical protein